MSEGVKLLISADDQATKVLNNVADNVDAKVKRIKEVGGRAKASTEFIGTLAQSLGGSELANYAGSLGQLTERISAFSEVSKAGGAGAALFKAGLAGVVAVGAFKAGEAIGNLVFETKRWKDELEQASKQSEKLFSQLGQVKDFRFSNEMELLSLIQDPDKQVAETKKMRDGIEKEILGLRATIKQTQDLQNDSNYAWFGSPEGRKQDQETIANAEKEIDALRQKRIALDQTTDARQKEIESLRQANALKDKNDSQIEALRNEVDLLKASKTERTAIEALQKAGGDVAAAARMESLMAEKEALMAKAEAEKLAADEAKKSADEQLRSTQKLADLRKNELAKLEEQRILLTQGKEAAHAFALEQQGLDRATAAKIAGDKAMLDKAGEKIQEQGPQQAIQGRLLTRGQGDDIGKRQLDEAIKQNVALRQLVDNSKQWKSQSEIVFEVVGRR